MREIVARYLSKSIDSANYKRWVSAKWRRPAAGLVTDQPMAALGLLLPFDLPATLIV